jgi:hypothetical protein
VRYCIVQPEFLAVLSTASEGVWVLLRAGGRDRPLVSTIQVQGFPLEKCLKPDLPDENQLPPKQVFPKLGAGETI